MAARTKFWRSSRWLDALRPDSDLAQAEGLAAGTGLLTGTVAKTAAAAQVLDTTPSCPSCDGSSEIVVVDLVVHATTLRCRSVRAALDLRHLTLAPSQPADRALVNR